MRSSGARFFVGATVVLLWASVAGAAEPAPRRVLSIEFENQAIPARQKELLSRYAQQVVSWASTAELVRAAEAQSATPLARPRILEIDRAWQAGGDPEGLATSLGRNACANSLRSLLASGSGFGEAFVTDSQGALVCMSHRTSDYWQGDEAKWVRSWAGGTGAVFVSSVAKDESTGLSLLHISVPIRSQGRLVGVLTVGRTLGSEGNGGGAGG